MALGKLPVPGRPTNLNYSRARASCAYVIGAGGGCLDIFLSSIISSLWETARYRLKYCLKGPSSQKQPNNQTRVDEWKISKQRHTQATTAKYVLALLLSNIGTAVHFDWRSHCLTTYVAF